MNREGGACALVGALYRSIAQQLRMEYVPFAAALSFRTMFNF